jgi:hypothetical protein
MMGKPPIPAPPNLIGAALPVSESKGGILPGPHSISLPYPAIENLPEFAGRIPSVTLTPGARHYNGSICRHQGEIFLAYRVESYSAVSQVGIAQLDEDFRVRRAQVVPIPCEVDSHIEDPRLCSVSGELFLMVADVRLRPMPICQQRLFEIDPVTLEPACEPMLGFGNINGIEKNWTPFQLPSGDVGFVYRQKPRQVVQVSTRKGWTTPEVRIAPEGSTLSGRTPPLRINEEFYLEFVGGWIRQATRGGRYWFAAQVFEAKEPFRVVKFSKVLCWGSEASPTLLSPRPRAGHPICIFPSGAMIEGDYVTVSCGVNDSYIALLRYSIPELLAGMTNA